MTRALIWDCDGVLVDSEKHSCSAWLPVLHRRGIDVDLDYIETFIGRSDGDLLQALSADTGCVFDDDVLEERALEYFRLAEGATESFPGLPQLLARLRRDRVPMAVASSGRLDKIRFSLRQAGIDNCFDILCSATEVALGKPAPDLFLLAAERLGVAPVDCAVVEDSVPGLQGAAAAGMRPIGFTASHPASMLLDAGAETTFDDYRQLPDLIWPNGIFHDK
ncbi:MAG: HAD family phosphatase [bacterium]|nr:HAD family phosphatase [bacterium]